jgi:hypothetical protein
VSPKPSNACHPSAPNQLQTRASRLVRIPAHAVSALSYHRACTTHHRLVDRRAPVKQCSNTLHVPFLAGDVQRRVPARLPRHTGHTHNKTSRPHAWSHHRMDTSAAPHYRDAPHVLMYGVDSITSRPCTRTRALPAYPTSFKRIGSTLQRSPVQAASALSCHQACTTHLHLVDRSAPVQQRPKTLYVPFLAGDVQRRGPVHLPPHTGHTPKPHALMPGLTTTLTSMLPPVVAMLPMT